MPVKNKIIRAVKNTILKYNMIQPGESIIVAVSGGADSICLMDILTALSVEMDIALVLAHYEHGLRPYEDEHETNLVKDYAGSLNLPFETERASGLNINFSSIEERARKLRYNFLERVRAKYNANKIAMGHNLNDQAETVLMRIMRGSGMTGLSGIPPVRDNIIRPLIEVSRKDIIDYLECRHLEYATDSSNNDKRFLRNKIRLDLLPEMIKYQPRIIETLGNLAQNLRDENGFFEGQAEKWVYDRLEQDESGDFFLNINLLKELPSAFMRRILRIIIKRYKRTLHGFDLGHVEDIIVLISNTRSNVSIDLPGDLIVRKEYNRLIFHSAVSGTGSFSYTIDGPGEIYIDEIKRNIRIEEFENRDQAIISEDANTAFLDKALLSYPLTIRNFHPGDRFCPLGMTGHKKVKNFFIDLKVPPDTRKQTPILLKGDKIAWVCGYRIDERFKVTAQTEKVLKITLTRQ